MSKLRAAARAAVLAFSISIVAVFFAPSAQATINCSGGENCWFEGANWTGTRTVMPIIIPNGNCYYWTIGYVRSYAQYGGQEGYFYSNTNCTGSVKATTAGSAGNTGFAARAFKGACVSCAPLLTPKADR
jgi:hypothetical protein